MKKINWKEGMGAGIIGTVMILVCFVLTLTIFQQLNSYNTAAKAQIVSDTVSDGSAVYGSLPMRVDEHKAYTMAQTLLVENQKLEKHASYSITSFDIARDLSRRGYKDNILTVNMEVTSPSIVINNGSRDFQKNVWSKVKILSLVPEHVDLGNAQVEIARALSEVPMGSPQYRALVRSLDYYGWKYSQELRWVDGARDCSSFVLSCYRDYTNVFSAHPSGYTQTIWNDAKAAGVLHEVNASDLDSNAFSYANLQVGDILLWHGSWADDLGRTPRGLGHTGIYLGVSAEDGLPKVIHASSSAGGVVISNLPGMHSGNGQLLGYVRIAQS